MKNKNFCQFLLPLVIFFSISATGWAMETSDSWVFRSEIRPGQSIWSPDISIPSYDFTDGVYFQSGIVKGTGAQYSVKANAGTVSGNVEGMITAQYNNRLAVPGQTKINLNYSGLTNESKISTSFAAALSGKGIFKVDLPWWVNVFGVTDLDYSLSLGFFEKNIETNTDFTTGLNHMAVGRDTEEILPFDFDLGVMGAKFNLDLKQDVYFTPETIMGTVKYTHMETQTQKEVGVEFLAGTEELALDLDLDLPGHWEVSLEDFYLDENTFSQDLDLLLELGIKIPVLGAEFGLTTTLFDMFDFFEKPFALDFLAHGYDGLDTTVDRLGRFNIYVDSVPLPGAVWLLGSGLVALIGLRRKQKIHYRFRDGGGIDNLICEESTIYP